MEFVLNRDKVVVTKLGHAIEFKKGVPTHVPYECHTAVQEVGAIPVSDLEEEKKPESPEPNDPAAREKMIFATFEALALKNERGTFTATGAPKDKPLEAALGFKIDAKERDALWLKFTQKDNE